MFGLDQSTPGKLKSPSIIIFGSGEFREKNELINLNNDIIKFIYST